MISKHQKYTCLAFIQLSHDYQTLLKYCYTYSKVSMISTAQTAKLFIELFLYTTGNRTTDQRYAQNFRRNILIHNHIHKI